EARAALRAVLADPAVTHGPHDRLAEWLRSEGVVPLAAAAIREEAWDLVPEGAGAALDARVRLAAAQIAVVVEAIPRVLGLLRRAGIEPVVLKGAVMAHRLYGNHRLRHAGDVDLLVTGAEWGPAAAALAATGYRALGPKSLPGQVRDEHEIQFVLGDPSARPGGPPDVDLHRGLVRPEVARLPGDWCEAGTETLDFLGERVTVLRPPLEALHAALHLSAHGFRFRQVVDLAGWDGRLTDEGRRELRETAREAGCEGLVLAGLRIAREVFGAPGDPLPAASRAARARARLLARFGVTPEAVFREGPLRGGHVRALVQVLAADRRGAAVAGTLRRVLGPVSPSRPFRLAGRLLREIAAGRGGREG
ncbi:MAG: nucleotidyltransferase family protein, partial [Planctomycetales bacterium]|nr:nucleotidyltransferase family protein [Planctomycetales bacterium]